jgi:hypothetical protein
VIDPTSAKPKPSPAGVRHFAILVETGGHADGVGEGRPATLLASAGSLTGGRVVPPLRNTFSANPCAFSASSRNSRGGSAHRRRGSGSWGAYGKPGRSVDGPDCARDSDGGWPATTAYRRLPRDSSQVVTDPYNYLFILPP